MAQNIICWKSSEFNDAGATYVQLVFSTNMGNVTKAGKIYVDNVKLISSIE